MKGSSSYIDIYDIDVEIPRYEGCEWGEAEGYRYKRMLSTNNNYSKRQCSGSPRNISKVSKSSEQLSSLIDESSLHFESEISEDDLTRQMREDKEEREYQPQVDVNTPRPPHSKLLVHLYKATPGECGPRNTITNPLSWETGDRLEGYPNYQGNRHGGI